MGYKMIEISVPQKEEVMEHIEKSYEHLGKAIESFEAMCDGQMGQRQDDEWYIRRMNRDRMPYGGYGERDEMDERGGYGERRGRSATTGRYTRMVYRDPMF